MNVENGFLKYLFIFLGLVSLALGIIGLVMPVLPTTPFLLLASFLFYRSSKRLHDWLLRNKVLGEYIRNYQTYHAIKRNTKIMSIIFLWCTLSISFSLVDNLYIRILLVVIGLVGTTHILSIKTLENVINKDG